MTLETLSATQQRLSDAGFEDDLIARDGRLHATRSGQNFDPRELFAAEIVRFEGNSDPDDEALLVAVATRAGAPVGTFTVPYGPNTSADEAEVLRHLHRVVASAEEIAAHDKHDHVAAVFPSRETAEAAVADLREIGLGSEHLGIAVHQSEPAVFEHDEAADLAKSTEAGVATGAVLGFLGGMLLFGLAVPGLGAGGILALGAAGATGGAMTGGFWGVFASSDEFDEHEDLRQTSLNAGEVLVVACSHNHRQAVEDAFLRHAGRLTAP